MPFQFHPTERNASLDAIETSMGTGCTLRLRSGPPPADCLAAATGTVLATITLPADFLTNAANGLKSILGTWQDTAADAAGTAGHFEITNASRRCIQGNVTATGGGGDMEIQNTSIAVGQSITVTAFNITAGGA